MAVFRVKRAVIDEIDATADDVARCKSWSVRLARARGAEAVTVVSVIAVRMLVPSWQSIDVDAVRREADSHVAVTTFTHDLHLEVVQSACGRYGVRRANARRIFVCFSVTLAEHNCHTIYTKS